jgi:hypothetical protein
MAQQQVDISAMSLEQLNTYKGQFENEIKQLPVWKSTSASGAPGIATPSSRRRVDGVEVDETIQRTRRKI